MIKQLMNQPYMNMKLMKKSNLLTPVLLVAILALPLIKAFCQETRPRVVVMTDGEIDDRSSMVRFLLNTNDIELEAIIETNSVYQKEGHSNKDWLEKQLDAYEIVYPNLVIHDPDYPSPDEIRARCFVGDEDPEHLVVNSNSPGRRPGDEPQVRPDKWADTPGSDRIVEVLLEKDPRPVYIQAWGGGNTAARAFYTLKKDHPEEYERAVSRAFMYNIWYQDGAGNYIERYHPGVTMLLSDYFHGSWDYGSQSFTYTFVEKEVKNGHGPLGALYPQDYISEGDSPAMLWIFDNGLRSYEDPGYGGWGGRFHRVEGMENVYTDISTGSYSRWIEAANRDFQSRLDWCVAERFEDANHKPEIHIKGAPDRMVRSGETVTLDASGTTDPDGDKLRFSWWQHDEAGTFDGIVRLSDPLTGKTSFTAPEVEERCTIHLILEVKDRAEPSLFSFQRIIITVEP